MPVLFDLREENFMSTETTVYEKLREQLDQYSIGFPATASGTELKILRKMFTEEEADAFLYLTMGLETPQAFAERTGRDPEAAAALLERMADKGLVFRLRRGETVKYAATPFVVGFFEYQLPTMDREFAELTDRYMDEAFSEAFAKPGPMLRPIPVNRSVEVSHPVATYEDSRQILRRQRLIAVAECICRKQQNMLDKGCDKPREVCFVFGAHAEYYLERNMARQITVEEGDIILDTAEKAGLVPQPFNTVNPGGMCNCCGDCCGVLRGLNKHPKPAEIVISNYWAEVDEGACIGCETCIERCQMGAITMNEDGVAAINLDRCIGCGLCVTTCPSEAMHLEVKPESARKTPPATNMDQVTQMAEARGTSLIPFTMRNG
jgi:Na+-translocating ferredoxin:NAD+ oxidoreductase subunit B